MKRLKNLFFYVIIIGGFSTLIYWITFNGKFLEEGRGIISKTNENSPFQDFLGSLQENLHHSVALLILQIVIIVIVARCFGWIFKKIGQPSVIGEILAGIILGPSLLGLHFPEVSAFLFPVQSLGSLQVLSQIGLILFMFVIGMELNLKALQSKAHEAIVISHASIIIPFSLGVGLSYFIYGEFAPEHVDFTSFSLFIGIALSITAFPVLARIIQEQGIHKTKLGAIVITCAAADDITAWCLLAVVIAIVKAGSFVSSLYTIFLALGYVIFMLKVLRPFLQKIGKLYQAEKDLNQSVVAIFFVVLLLSAFITETIGIHALFGAFMAGAIMPDNMNFRKLLIGKIEDVALVLLLPIFFVISGLRTEIGLIDDPKLWEVTGLIILLAILGKFVGSAIAAKVVGQNWKDSLTIGALMNTRGLMELVALNIGYELGILKAEIFAMMVIMALVTTFMAGPILKLINKVFKKENSLIQERIHDITKQKIMLFFRNSERGVALVKLADCLSRKADENTVLTAVHMASSNGLQQIDIEEYERDSFSSVITKANSLNRNIEPSFKISNDISTDLAGIVNNGESDLLLINVEESIFEGSLLGRVLGFATQIINPEKLINTVTGKEKLIESSPIDNNTRLILSKIKIPVGIMIDKDFEEARVVLVPIFDEKDEFLISYAQKLIKNVGAQVTILNLTNSENGLNIRERIRLIEHNAPNHIRSISIEYIDSIVIDELDLIIISLNSFEKFVGMNKEWVDKSKSILICKN